MTASAPSDSGQVVQAIGVARSETELLVMPGLNYEVNSNESFTNAGDGGSGGGGAGGNDNSGTPNSDTEKEQQNPEGENPDVLGNTNGSGGGDSEPPDGSSSGQLTQ
jgi:hypothetical protein